jgi:hypothetical protein
MDWRIWDYQLKHFEYMPLREAIIRRASIRYLLMRPIRQSGDRLWSGDIARIDGEVYRISSSGYAYDRDGRQTPLSTLNLLNASVISNICELIAAKCEELGVPINWQVTQE